jgi:dihydrofolate synthase/folylpolyglutamate synthase
VFQALLYSGLRDTIQETLRIEERGLSLPVTYPDSVQFLYALGNEMKTAKLGLERISAVLKALGDPQRAFRVVHVAGTNGKGSTCAMIEAGLRTSGIRTGLFTSPHLIEPTERIQVDGIPVSQSQFSRAFALVHEVAGTLSLDAHPSYFETVTAMAFWLFRELGVETAVVEVGLGGRLDSTNIVEPALTVITSIDLDHQIYLGDTIEQIAAEKAGILKPGVPAIFAKQRPDAMAVLEARARELGVPVRRAEDYPVQDLEIDARGSRFSVAGFAGLECPLAGEHQAENAVTATLALDALGVSPKGICEARWPGRMELVSPNPDVILDGAHNPAGARSLEKYIQRFYPHRKRWMIFGAMADKQINEIGAVLFPLADELILTAAHTTRSAPPEMLRETAGRGWIAPELTDALGIIKTRATAEDVILITGSLFLVGEARAASYNRNSWPFSGAWS